MVKKEGNLSDATMDGRQPLSQNRAQKSHENLVLQHFYKKVIFLKVNGLIEFEIKPLKKVEKIFV